MHRFALFTALVSFLLIIAGGLVTSTGSGLSVPDWPLSYGSLLPPMVGGIRFEHTHRMIAAAVGLLTLILMVWLLVKEPRRGIRRLGVFAFGLILLQGILGGITVLRQLPLAVSVAHACLGQTFFALIVTLAQVTSPRWKPRHLQPEERPSLFLRQLALGTAATVYLQLILGAIIRHAGWRPHLIGAHLAWALVVCFCIVAATFDLLRRHRRDPLLARPALALLGLLLLQMTLGFATLARGRSVALATGHVAVGALLLATAVLLAARVSASFPRKWESDPCGSLPSSVIEGEDDIGKHILTYLELTKPRLTALAVITGLIGFLLASNGWPDFGKLFSVLLGTALLGGGAGALNQVLEQDADALMTRTRRRPIPSGRLNPESALCFGVITCVAGLILLTVGANRLAGALASATLGIYLFLYTPLKSRTALCTLIGAVPGALPPLIGWAAARGSLGIEAWLLFAILFLWQLPHFLALAWEFREDYARAGFKMLPVLDPEGGLTFRQIALYCAALVPVSLLPAILGSAGSFYFFGALVGSLAFLGIGLAAAQRRSPKAARRLFLASVLYLPFLFVTMSLDKVIS